MKLNIFKSTQIAKLNSEIQSIDERIEKHNKKILNAMNEKRKLQEQIISLENS